MSLAPNNKVETHKTNKDESCVCCNTEPIVESLAQRNSKENSNETLNARQDSRYESIQRLKH